VGARRRQCRITGLRPVCGAEQQIRQIVPPAAVLGSRLLAQAFERSIPDPRHDLNGELCLRGGSIWWQPSGSMGLSKRSSSRSTSFALVFTPSMRVATASQSVSRHPQSYGAQTQRARPRHGDELDDGLGHDFLAGSLVGSSGRMPSFRALSARSACCSIKKALLLQPPRELLVAIVGLHAHC
jgi:hypothetical protein